MLTLEEIAKLSGVSRSTVSRVINDAEHVSADVRARVQAVVREYNYQPNSAARGLAAGQTHILGLVIPTAVAALFSDPYFPVLIQGVAAACNAREYSVMLWVAEPEYERRTIRQVLHNGLVDGIIVSSMVIDDPLIAALADSTLPFVLIGRHPTAATVNYLDADNRQGALTAVTHLFNLGYQRIATIAGPQNTIVGWDRLEGYKAALQAQSLPVQPELIMIGNFTEEGGEQAMQRLLPHAPRAVFVASDTMAVGALRAIYAAGLRVPDDIALVGFDDIPLSARLTPPLTTVRQPIRQLGGMAVQLLLEAVAHPEAGPYRMILATELVVRESCGAQHHE